MTGLAVLFLPLVLAAGPPLCCTSTKFTATLLEIGGYVQPIINIPTPIDLMATVYYDYDDKLLRADRNVPREDGTMERITVISNYNLKKTYTIVGGACHVTNQTEPITPNCVPANATFVAMTKIGSSDRSFLVHTWRLGPVSNVTTKITLTVNHCIPFSESTFGMINGVMTEVSYMFMDFKHSVPDRIFTVPDSCHETVHGPVVGRSILKSMFLP